MLYAECWGYDHRETPEYPLVCIERQPEQEQVGFPGASPKVGRVESIVVRAQVSANGKVVHMQRLTQLPERFLEMNPLWSPDGQHIAFDLVDARQRACLR